MDRKNSYDKRIEMVMHYIQENPTNDLNLTELADIAAFSPYHFHRIFTTHVGETVNQYVTRVRMDHAVKLLKSEPEHQISEVAEICGFSTLSVFSRAFKHRYGINPSQWNRQNLLIESRNFESKLIGPYYSISELEEIGHERNFNVRIDRISEMHVAYVRVEFACSLSDMQEGYDTLRDWCKRQGWSLGDHTLIGFSIDDHGQNPNDQCRYDIGIIMDKSFQAEGKVQYYHLPSFLAARLHCTGNSTNSSQILQYLYRYWMPRSEYLPADLPLVEIYNHQPDEIGWDEFDVDVLIPIEI